MMIHLDLFIVASMAGSGPLHVCVIGAGAAGLAALRHLTKRPDKFTATAFEQTGSIGGTWVYTDKIGTDQYGQPIHSSVYKYLK